MSVLTSENLIPLSVLPLVGSSVRLTPQPCRIKYASRDLSNPQSSMPAGRCQYLVFDPALNNFRKEEQPPGRYKRLPYETPLIGPRDESWHDPRQVMLQQVQGQCRYELWREKRNAV